MTDDAVRALNDAWSRAVVLEQQGQIDEAERVLDEADPSLYGCLRLAALHEQRMDRLLATKDVAGARTAFDRARYWLNSMAAGATSGGEGAALGQERDRLVTSMERKLGTMPG